MSLVLLVFVVVTADGAQVEQAPESSSPAASPGERVFELHEDDEYSAVVTTR